jgi:hypothetical protein
LQALKPQHDPSAMLSAMKEALNPLQASTPVHLLMQAGVFDV